MLQIFHPTTARRPSWKEVDIPLNSLLSLRLLQEQVSPGRPRRLGGFLIKLDIINEVVNRTGITKTKAEMAVETVFETMKKALGEGDRIELRGFRDFQRQTSENRNRPESPYRRGSSDSAWKSSPL